MTRTSIIALIFSIFALASNASQPEPPFDDKASETFIFKVSNGKSQKYLRVTLELHTPDAKIASQIRAHQPVIRDAIVELYAGKNYKFLSTEKGKQSLLNETSELLVSKIKSPKSIRLVFADYTFSE